MLHSSPKVSITHDQAFLFFVFFAVRSATQPNGINREHTCLFFFCRSATQQPKGINHDQIFLYVFMPYTEGYQARSYSSATTTPQRCTSKQETRKAQGKGQQAASVALRAPIQSSSMPPMSPSTRPLQCACPKTSSTSLTAQNGAAARNSSITNAAVAVAGREGKRH